MTKLENTVTPEQKDKYDDILRQARYKARYFFPYFTSSLMALKFKIDNTVSTGDGIDEHGNLVKGKPTFAVDQYFRCYVHPEAIDQWIQDARAVTQNKPCKTCGKTAHHDLAYIAGVIIHEMIHPLRKHSIRAHQKLGKGYHAGLRNLVNVAMDCEINDNIMEAVNLTKNADVCLPEWVVFPKMFDLEDGLFWEEYYDKLYEKADKIQVSADCGSGADGQARDHDEGGDGSQDFDGVSEAEAQAMAKKVASDTREHAQKNPGTVPGGFSRWADEQLEPAKVNWREKLRKCIHYGSKTFTSGHKNTTFSRSSVASRVLEYKAIIPTYHKPVPKVALIIDTSGSMSKRASKEALQEAQGVINTIKAKCTIISCDAAAKVSGTTKNVKSIQLEGGGGTVLSEGVKLALSLRDKPNAIVILTDGYDCFKMDRPPNSTVIVCLVGEQTTSEAIPDWMLVVKVDLEIENKQNKAR